MFRRAIGMALLFCAPLLAQEPPKATDTPVFEVASIKSNTSGGFIMNFSFQPGGQLVMVNAPVMMLLLQSYRIPDYRIVGVPAWARSARYDILAKADGDPPPEQMQQMARSLLAQRFRLSAHMETRDQDGFALVPARRDGGLGPQLLRSSIDCAARSAAQRRGQPLPPPPPAANGGPVCTARTGPGTLTSGAMTMELLALSLSLAMGRPVVDKTGLAGDYEFALTYAPESRPRAGIDDTTARPDDAASIFTAVQEQLGLKLEAQRNPADFLVVDRLERPTED